MNRLHKRAAVLLAALGLLLAYSTALQLI